MEERNKHFERPTTSRPPSLFSLVILAAVIGLLAGSVGYLVVQSSDLSNNTSYLNYPDASRLEVNIDQPLVNLARKYQQSIAGVYRPIAKIGGLEQALFSDKDYLGGATVVTSDGWLMSTDQVIKNDSPIIVLGDHVYEIEELRQDQFTGVVFAKIDASFLQPVDFQLTNKLEVGERLFTNIDLSQSIEHAFYTDYLAHDHYIKNSFLSTDQVDYYLQLNNPSLPDNALAAPYFNVKGDMLGLLYDLADESVLLPAEYLKQAVKHLLDNTERVSLGVSYVDLENNSGFLRKGHIIYNPSLPAVEYNSVGFKAGLRLGDQIVAVNSDVVSDQKTLTSILQNYRLGDKVVIRILRNEVEQDIEVEL
jgi:hypothetical protein